MVDEVVACDVTMHDGRAINATLETHGFMLAEHPTCVSNFEDSNEVISSYYGEIMELVKRTSGASRVFVFDHTLRETGSTSLNADDSSAKAAPVPRVHCDYTATGAPKRLLQLGQDGIHSRIKDRTLTAAEVDSLAAGRFAFVNVWRSIDPVHPVLQNPLAVCDENTVPDDDRFLYELRFLDRTGENYSLQYSPAHKWYYYPNQTMDECLVFKVYDKKTDGPRFVFHTAFDDPRSQPDAPPRKSVEVRTICFFDDDDALPNGSDEAVNRPMFFDMKHSNNAARIRLWLRMDDNPHSGEIDTTMVRYDDLKTPEFAKVNPLAKVPGFIREDGTTVFESNVILQYLEDKFGPLYTPQSAEDKQLMNLQVSLAPVSPHSFSLSRPRSLTLACRCASTTCTLRVRTAPRRGSRTRKEPCTCRRDGTGLRGA